MNMTPREALKIQAAQIAHYSFIGDHQKALIADSTDIAGIDLDQPMDIIEINRRIPRGCDIGYILGISL